MFKSLILLLAFLCFSGVANPLEPMKVNPPGKPSISVFISDSPNFVKEWVNTPPSYSPVVKRIKQAKYNQMVHAGFAIP